MIQGVEMLVQQWTQISWLYVSDVVTVNNCFSIFSKGDLDLLVKVTLTFTTDAYNVNTSRGFQILDFHQNRIKNKAGRATTNILYVQ